MAVVPRRFIVIAALVLIAALRAAGEAQPPDIDALVQKVRDGIRREYADPVRFNYIEEGRDVDISMLGKVSVGPLQTFEVRQNPPGDAWRRLVAVDGKPVPPEELARRDAEHERLMRKRQSESARQRTTRQREEAEETKERDEILDDAARVFAFSFVERQTVDGQPLVVVDLTPRPNAQVTTSEGARMKKFAGRLWVSDPDYSLARVRLHAIDSVSVGWGAVARVDRGSGFDFIRKKIDGEWVAASLTIEGSGNTLLFRSFKIKTVTTYSNHRAYGAHE